MSVETTTETKCTHPRTRKLGTRIHFGAPCERTGVPAGTYTVTRCTRCRKRFDVCAVTARSFAYDPENLSESNTQVTPDDPAVYTPVHDGVDASPERYPDSRAADECELFDARGGADGVGDAPVFSDGGVSC